MLAQIFAPKLLVLYTFIGCGVYVHYRGKVRHKFFRQLSDHSTIMAPVNCFMYLFSRVPNKPYVDVDDFSELQLLRDNWQAIREEALQLSGEGHIKKSDKLNDLGFNSFFKTGWTRFYLQWYQDYLPSAKKLCPKTIELLRQCPSVKAAMFTMLPPGGTLVRHRDPYAGSLRYHLGLVTPGSDDCYIAVDGEKYSWRDGEDVMFDETYIHYAANNSDTDRLILFCDIERPMNNPVAKWFNRIFGRFVVTSSATKNLDTDKVGLLNRLFGGLYQIRIIGKKLKAFNKPLYYVVKWALFGLILWAIFF